MHAFDIIWQMYIIALRISAMIFAIRRVATFHDFYILIQQYSHAIKNVNIELFFQPKGCFGITSTLME